MGQATGSSRPRSNCQHALFFSPLTYTIDGWLARWIPAYAGTTAYRCEGFQDEISMLRSGQCGEVTVHDKSISLKGGMCGALLARSLRAPKKIYHDRTLKHQDLIRAGRAPDNQLIRYVF